MPKFMLVGVKFFGKDKKYYQAVLVDDDTNIINVFITEEVYKYLQNFVYKDITNLCYLVYDRNSGYYRIAIEKN